MLFLGTIPSASVEDAVSWMLDAAAPRLWSIPDGEPGERNNWIKPVIDAFRGSPALQLTVDGDWSSYSSLPEFRIRPGASLSADDLPLPYAANARTSWPIVRELCERHGRSDLPFQVDIPSDLHMTRFTFGAEGLEQRPLFAAATVREIAAIREQIGDDVVFQISAPAEMVFTTLAPADGQAAVAAEMARGLADLVAATPPGTRVGVHLCHGDMNHVALGGMDTTAPLILLANALADAWPDGRPFEYLHAPLAAGQTPPPLDAAFYAPLGDLRLPAGTRFVAGLAHEDQSLGDQLIALAHVDAALGQAADVATTCGLGRRSREAAAAAIERTVELAAAGVPA